MTKAGPIFVRGLSRSGGTLLVTVLDSHPDVAMSYELYPLLLEARSDPPMSTQELLEVVTSAKSDRQVASLVRDKNFRVFTIRCLRGGIGHQRLAELLATHIANGDGFDDVEGRFRFLERCGLSKMEAEGKSIWGLKCLNRFQDYLDIWPQARFINIIRDGRDVLASQLNTGSFQRTPEKLGRGWANTHLRFREFMERNRVRACEVRYEEVVGRPEKEIRRICDFLDIPFSLEMLDYHQKDLSIYAATHLSMDRISRPIDSSRVGRWKTDLSDDQVTEFHSTAGDAMKLFGYLE